jgi:hypothetical protein
MDMDKLLEFLDLYFQGLKTPKISEKASKIIVREIVAGIRVLMKNPNISYGDWWEELHELFHEDYFNF